MEIDTSTLSAEREPSVIRRRCVRAFFAVLVLILSLDVVPWGVLPDDRPKELLSQLTNRAGIWQGQWSMFTPTPAVDNFWLTATIDQPSGAQVEWSSTYWPTASCWEKFYQFRFMNFYNRLNLPRNRPATVDFSQYLLRTLGESPASESRQAFPTPQTSPSIELFMNRFTLVPRDDKSMPPADEITWLMSSESVACAPEQEGEPE